jgi:hypothetical protein
LAHVHVVIAAAVDFANARIAHTSEIFATTIDLGTMLFTAALGLVAARIVAIGAVVGTTTLNVAGAMIGAAALLVAKRRATALIVADRGTTALDARLGLGLNLRTTALTVAE